MQIQEKLQEGKFLKRYKRFFADIELNGEVVVAHVPNTGSLKTCLFANAPCIVSESSNPMRKLKATLHFIKTPTSWVGVNTGLPNPLVHEAWETRKIADWHKFQVGQREYKISKESRLDLVLARDADDLASKKNLHHIEVKNVTLAEGDTALFPDAVTTRGQKHLQDLMNLKKAGHGAEIVFVVQRHDCRRFAPAEAIDPEYARLLRQAHQQGVVIRALSCEIDPQSGVTLNSDSLELSL